MDGGLRSEFKKRLRGVDWQSVETAMTGGGVPDSNYCVDGAEGWVEYKATRGWVVRVRPAQVGWIERRLRHGGRVLVAVRRKNASVDQLWLFAGAAVRQLKVGGILAVDAGLRRGMWDGGPGNWDWGAVLAGLKGVRT